MAEYACVCWVEDNEPWNIEDKVIERYDVPLNLDKNHTTSSTQS